MAAQQVQLIVGLGNPGAAYQRTRHNAGAEFVERLAAQAGIPLRDESRFFGKSGELNVAGHRVRLLVPTTFMNRSGQSVAAMANFFRIPVNELLVAHDELDLPPGVVRLKIGGGHGGHNGLRDIMQALGGANEFARLRFGIGHPGSAAQVTNYALGRADASDRQRLDDNFSAVERVLPDIVEGHFAAVMQQLHQKAPPPTNDNTDT